MSECAACGHRYCICPDLDVMTERMLRRRERGPAWKAACQVVQGVRERLDGMNIADKETLLRIIRKEGETR